LTLISKGKGQAASGKKSGTKRRRKRLGGKWRFIARGRRLYLVAYQGEKKKTRGTNGTVVSGSKESLTFFELSKTKGKENPDFTEVKRRNTS